MGSALLSLISFVGLLFIIRGIVGLVTYLRSRDSKQKKDREG